LRDEGSVAECAVVVEGMPLLQLYTTECNSEVRGREDEAILSVVESVRSSVHLLL
jgi:hypothetical protein